MSKKSSLRKLKSQTRPNKTFSLYTERLIKNLKTIQSYQSEQLEESENIYSSSIEKNTSALSNE